MAARNLSGIIRTIGESASKRGYLLRRIAGAALAKLRLKPRGIGGTIRRWTQIEDRTSVIESRALGLCRGGCANRLSLTGP